MKMYKSKREKNLFGASIKTFHYRSKFSFFDFLRRASKENTKTLNSI